MKWVQDGARPHAPMSTLGVIMALWVGLVNWGQGTEACSGRVILNSTSGSISDGPGNYPPSAHCEWLIDGKL